jgi:hypothetical protein
MPLPNKVVVLILENHAYNQVVGSPYAPYINNLINDSMTALFPQSYALTHPSQPNYIMLFSGSAQGVTTNNLPAGIPFTTPHLQSELAAASKTFIAYSQGLPSVGFTGETSGAYARKHAPWVNWQGAATNGFPPSLHVPFTQFPTNFNNLPTVSFIVPDQNNDMHSGTDPQRITQCDTWIQNNLNNYIQWARNNNSLLILTFDEDDDFSGNHIATFFFGPMVFKGSYPAHIDHYNVLRTLEDMFALTHAGNAATATPVDYCWKCPSASTISANGPATFCTANITLTATAGSSYLWSTGATTQSITIDSSGNYKCTVVQSTGCLSATNTITATKKNIPVINSFSPLGAAVGDVVTVNGSYFTGVTSVKLNNSAVSFTVVNDSKITFSVPSGSSSGNIEVANLCGTVVNGTQLYVAPFIALNLKFFIEGYYKSNGVMRSVLGGNKSDSVFLQLVQSTVPYQVLGSVLTTVDTSGIVSCNVPTSFYGNQYYLVLSGRNFLKTWSAIPVLLSQSTAYDFTTAASKAYGNNQRSLNGSFYFYSGDVNLDGEINLTDYGVVQNKCMLFTTGINASDLNGDKLVESIDLSILENNCIPIITQRP